MTLVAELGALALSSRLKSLSDRWYDDVDAAYRAHGSELQARWFPVLRALDLRGPLAVGEIAREVGLSHSAVSQLATRLARDGWVQRQRGGDRRERRLVLSAKSIEAMRHARPLWLAMRASVEARLQATGVDLLDVLAQLERGLESAPFAEDVTRRVRQAEQAAAEVKVVPYRQDLQPHFYRLNAEWLTKYYSIEPIDHDVLSHPEQYILAPGGAIFFVQVGDAIVGTCALMPESPGVYELTKMAVTEGHQGLGLGRRLIEAVIAEFHRLGGTMLFLESQKRLQSALKLYESVGFEMQPHTKPGTHYQRADVYMIYRGQAAKP